MECNFSITSEASKDIVTLDGKGSPVSECDKYHRSILPRNEDIDQDR